MNRSLQYAVCGAVVAFSLAACDAGAAELEKKPVAGIRHQLDSERNRVWLLTGEGVAIYDAAAPDKVLRIPIPGWQFAGAPYGCLPDLALGPMGEAVISSDVVPVLWRIDPRSLAVTRHELQLDADTDKDVGFSSLTYLPGPNEFLAVSGLHGTVWRIDPQLRQAHKVAYQVPRMKSCGARAAAAIPSLSRSLGRVAPPAVWIS
jgi:hypothetical protein